MGFLKPIISFGIGLLMIVAVSAMALAILNVLGSIARVYDPLG